MKKTAKVPERVHLEMLNEIRDGLFTTDHKGMITFVNAPLAEMHGLSGPEEMIGRHFIEFVSPEFKTEVSNKFEKAIEDKSYSEVVEFCAARKDGGTLFMQLRHGPVIKNGRIVGTAGVIREVTEQKRAEQALAASEQRYRAIVENMSDVVFIVDRTGTLLFITPSATRLIGYEPSEMIGHNIRQFIHPEDLDAALKNIGHTISEKKIIGNEYRLMHKNGGLLWIQTFTRPLFEGDEVVALQGAFRDITERKQTEEALKAGERKFRDLITNMQEVLYMVDRSGRITFVTPSVESVTQYRDSEVIGHPMEEFIFRDDLPRLYQDFQNFFSGTGKTENEYRMVTKPGEIRWMRTSSSLLHEGGEAVGIQGILSDITDRKRSQEALRESEERFRLFMNNSPTIAWIKDELGRFVYLSKTYEDRFGLRSEDCRGKTDAELWDETTAEQFRRNDLAVLKANHAIEFLEETVNADGTRCYWLNCKFPFRDAAGNRFVAGIGLDITERKQMEEALRESEEKFRSLVETTSDRIWETDAHGAYIYVSPRVRDLLGYEPEEVVGRKPYEFMPPDEAARLKAKFSRFAKERRPFVSIENVNIGRHGRRVVLETSGVPRLDEGGDLLGYRGVDRDITDRKRAEEALQRSHDELEIRVQERTAELERRNQELQNFTFAASHDLQEPLRKIQTFTDLLATRYHDLIGGQGGDYLRRMHETATRMRDVLQSLMKYSRLTSRVEPFCRVDLNEIARAVVSDLELRIRDAGAMVEIGDLPEIEADAAQMRQLFQNLLGNGLKFHREGIRPKIVIRADCSSGDHECDIHIQDNGIGFEEKYLDRIFKPFQRLHGKHEYGGIGMGLAICAKVVEHHNGRIAAVSTPGEGSTFTVTLPVRQSGKNRKACLS